jgi:internalin A
LDQEQPNLRGKRGAMTVATTSRVKRAIDEARNKKLEELDLSGMGLRSLPTSIRKLTSLSTLHLSGNELTTLPSWIGEMGQLRELHLASNKLTELPDSICELVNVAELSLHKNNLTRLPRELGDLQNLQVLGLSNNRLESIPRSLGRLSNLRILYLSGYKSELPAWLGELTELQAILLHDCPMMGLPGWVRGLRSLATLGVVDTGINELPEWLGDLTNIKELFAQRNQLTVLPESIGALSLMDRMYLSENRINKLPECIGQLNRLRRLLLDSNQIKLLPKSIGQLKALQELDLSRNRLRRIGRGLNQLPLLKMLFLHENPGLRLPPEILGPTALEARVGKAGEQIAAAKTKDILSYLAQIATRRDRPFSEAKLLLVGQGGVGKTSLVRYLVHNQKAQAAERITEGIRRETWSRRVRHPSSHKSHDVRLNVWDFGGQEIMHATHQFFLTKRSLYLLVLDARTTDAENNIYYWLKMIQSFGGEAPVIVVVNKADESIELELNETRLRKDFAPNLRGFCRVSCREGTGIAELRKAIDGEIALLQHVFDPVPMGYIDVKDRLGAWAETKNYISLSSYEQLCSTAGLARESCQPLLRFLHDLGVVLNFDDPDDAYDLHDTNVLNPEWVTDAVYRIITNPALRESRGVLLRTQLPQLLNNKKRFPASRHDFIIDIMRKFELCFDFPDASGDRFLVPERLDKIEPDVGWNEDASLNLQIRYNVLPPGLVCRLIVKMHKYLRDPSPMYWRYGAVLYVYGNRCLVRGSVEDRRIYIAVQGAEETRREALLLIRGMFDEIHRTIKGLETVELVPVPGQSKVTVEYDSLVRMVRNEIDRFLPDGGTEPASASQLLRIVDAPQRAQSIADEERSGAIARDGIARIAQVGGARSVLTYDDVPRAIDFGIITIKEEEFVAVERSFAPVRYVNMSKRNYLHSQVVGRDGRRRDVLIARCLEQGQSDAQQCTNDLIQDANPKWILVVGIAGAFPVDEYSLGDVILASRIHDFAVTAAVEGRREQSPKGGAVHPDVARLLEMIPSRACLARLGDWNGSAALAMPKPNVTVPKGLSARAYYGAASWARKVRDSLNANFPHGTPARLPLYRVASVASANVLVKDTKLAKEWKLAARGVGHVEMELGGVYVAAQRANKPVLSVRGISDVVGLRRSSAWTEYACQSAAAFSRSLVASGLAAEE